jgi:poly-gamma-glutamate capsule biosynthesis protein CapA/YwtB (metallophosphatase superfamily)
MRGFNRPCDVIVASIHWGNWGYRTRDEETRFAHQLIEHGIAVVHGHSSHHVKTAEIHSDRLVLYACGDFLPVPWFSQSIERTILPMLPEASI